MTMRTTITPVMTMITTIATGTVTVSDSDMPMFMLPPVSAWRLQSASP